MRSLMIDRSPSSGIVPVLLTLAFAAASSTAHAVPCPESTLNGVPSTVAVRDSFHGIEIPPDTLQAHYDLTTGTLSCLRRGFLTIQMEIELADEYELVGLPAGTAVPLVARFAYHNVYDFGTDVSGMSFRVRLLEGTTNVAEAQGVWREWSDELELPIASVAGTAFQLRSRYGWSARDGRGRANAGLSFSGIPPGSFLRSCQGYRQDGPVAAAATSWGRVKIRYR